MAKDLNDLDEFDKNFATDADIEDGFVESDGARMEREARENAIRAFKESRRQTENANKTMSYEDYRKQVKADADRYNSLSEDDAKHMTDEEMCRLYDAAMQQKEFDEDEDEIETSD